MVYVFFLRRIAREETYDYSHEAYIESSASEQAQSLYAHPPLRGEVYFHHAYYLHQTYVYTFPKVAARGFDLSRIYTAQSMYESVHKGQLPKSYQCKNPSKISYNDGSHLEDHTV